MKFKPGDEVRYIGGPSEDATVYMDPDDPNLGRPAVIVRPATGGWHWVIRTDRGDEFNADECQLHSLLH